MLLAIIFFFAGASISWLIAHFYYKRSSKDAFLLYEKFNEESRKLILDAQGSSLSVKDLNVLLKERVIDKESDEYFPFRVCPECGSENIIPGEDVIVDEEYDGMGGISQSPTFFPTLKCEDCGWYVDGISDYNIIEKYKKENNE